MKKDQFRGHNFVLPLRPYPYEVMVSIGQTATQLRTYMKAHGFEPDHIRACTHKTRASGTVTAFPDNRFLLRLTAVPDNPKGHGCLAHEVFHVISVMMAKIDCPLEIEVSDEPYAYMVGYLTEQIYARI